ncbi:MAG: hypothetical protein MJ222_01050 [Bacilli bacterium]|nr:hypothetical protein [Bacilli bacterium]
MLSFLKVFARGIICTVLLPLILAVWVLYGAYCLIAFMVMLVKSIIVFFAGGNAAGEMKEDIEAKRILLEAEQAKVEQAQVMNMMYQNMAVQQQMMQQQMMQQGIPQPAMPTPEPAPQPQPAQFDPFIPDEVPKQPLPGAEEEQPINNGEGGNDNGQSY